MPVLEKMNWTDSPSERHPDNLVWKWIRQSPGLPPVGRWMAEDESVGPILVDYDEDPPQEIVEERWAVRARERRRMALMERRVRIMNTHLMGHAHVSQMDELMEHEGPSADEYEEQPDDLVEEEVVDVVDGGIDPLPSSSFPSTQEWGAIYEETQPPAPPEAYDEKHPDYDAIAVAAFHRSRKEALRLSKLQKHKNEEDRKRQLKAEREAKLLRESMAMAEEKKKREAVDDVMESRRAKRADYVRRLRAEKRMEMGEKEWMKHLEKEREKRRQREKKKMETPGYIEKKRMRQTLKTREIRANQAIMEGRRLHFPRPSHFPREEEVHEDGIFEMEETEVNQSKDGVLPKTEEEEIEVEKW